MKKVRNVYFGYSNKSDFGLKLFILQVISQNLRILGNIEIIEFDYVRTIDEIEILSKLNNEIKNRGYSIVISYRLMPTNIKSQTSLENILAKSK